MGAGAPADHYRFDTIYDPSTHYLLRFYLYCTSDISDVCISIRAPESCWFGALGLFFFPLNIIFGFSISVLALATGNIGKGLGGAISNQVMREAMIPVWYGLSVSGVQQVYEIYSTG